MSLLSILEGSVYHGGVWEGGWFSFMLLTNESLRLRLKPVVEQTSSITMTKVHGQMQHDKSMVEIKKDTPLFHTVSLGVRLFKVS